MRARLASLAYAMLTCDANLPCVLLVTDDSLPEVDHASQRNLRRPPQHSIGLKFESVVSLPYRIKL